MAASTRQVTVSSPEQLDQTISSYIAQGFSVMNRNAAGATMFKKKEFSILWLVVGFILCVVPLLIYLIIYASQSDQMVEIRVVSPTAVGQLSPDGRWRWDGATWQAVPEQAPPAATAALPPPPPPPPPSPEPASGDASDTSLP